MVAMRRPSGIDGEPGCHRRGRRRLAFRTRRRRMAHPGNHLPRAEGFGDVVVGAEFEADDTVHLVRAGGEKKHRHLRPAAQRPADVEALMSGRPTSNDQVIAAGGLPGQGLGPRVQHSTAKPSALRHVSQGVGNGGFVVDDEDVHGRMVNDYYPGFSLAAEQLRIRRPAAARLEDNGRITTLSPGSKHADPPSRCRPGCPGCGAAGSRHCPDLEAAALAARHVARQAIANPGPELTPGRRPMRPGQTQPLPRPGLRRAGGLQGGADQPGGAEALQPRESGARHPVRRCCCPTAPWCRPASGPARSTGGSRGRGQDAAINRATTPAEVLRHVARLYPFIRLPDLMLEARPPGGPALVLVNAGARLGVLGKPSPSTPATPGVETLAAMTVRLFDQDGKNSIPAGSCILGHPWKR